MYFATAASRQVLLLEFPYQAYYFRRWSYSLKGFRIQNSSSSYYQPLVLDGQKRWINIVSSVFVRKQTLMCLCAQSLHNMWWKMSEPEQEKNLVCLIKHKWDWQDREFLIKYVIIKCTRRQLVLINILIRTTATFKPIYIQHLFIFFHRILKITLSFF